ASMHASRPRWPCRCRTRPVSTAATASPSAPPAPSCSARSTSSARRARGTNRASRSPAPSAPTAASAVRSTCTSRTARSYASPRRSTIPSRAATSASRDDSAGASSRVARSRPMPPPERAGLPSALRPDHPLRGLGYSQPVRRRSFLRLDGARVESDEAEVAEEVPVALVYNTRPYAVMMATPADLEDFAVGFSITEAIVAAGTDIDRVAVMRHAQGIEVQVGIPDTAAARLAERGRALIGRAGCGLCGVETIQEAMREPDPLPPGPPISAEALWRAERELVPRQVWNAETGSLHAAGWFDLD